MKKLLRKVLLLAAFLLVLSGCGAKTADEKRILTDLEQDTQFQFLEPGEEISEVIIEERQTDKKQKTDVVRCSVTVKDSQTAYKKGGVLVYVLQQKEGWILDNVSVDDAVQWVQTPLAGVEESSILPALAAYSVVADNERWDIKTDEVETFLVEQHETNLEAGTDTVTVSLTLDGEVEKAMGQLVISYRFDNGWNIDAISGDTEFTTAVKPEAALQVENEDLLDVIMNEQKFQYGEPKHESGYLTYADNSTRQTITLDRACISDFVMENVVSSGKGSCRDYTCSFTLTKPYVTFRIEAEIQYCYSYTDGWESYLTVITPQVTDIDIDGEWIGTYQAAGDSGDVRLSLQTDENGLLTAVYSYVPAGSTGYDQPGSY